MAHHPDVVAPSTPATGTRRLYAVDRPCAPIPVGLLGRTRRIASALGLGLAGLGRPAYMALGRHDCLGHDRSVAAMRQRCSALLDAAFAAGVRYFDAARSYGLAEAFLRSWCEERAMPPGAITIGSKWGYVYTGGWQTDAPRHETKRLTLSTLQWQGAESRAILGRWLSLYQIHSATLDSGVFEDREVLRELFHLRAAGLAIGLTVSGPNQADAIRRALDVAVDGVPLFDTVQATWNLLEPSAGPALAEASAGGRAVIVKEVLANGRLTSRYGGPEVRHLAAYSRTHGVPMETLAVSAALRQPWTSVVLSGAVTCQQLRDQLAAFEIGEAMRPPVRAQSPEEYWRVRDAIAWQ